jgi:hypothetical protein
MPIIMTASYKNMVWIQRVARSLKSFPLYGLGAILCMTLGPPLGSLSAFAQDYERRDPAPRYESHHYEPFSPRLVKRWDTVNGDLVIAGATLDTDNPFSNAPSYLIQFNEPGVVVPIFSWQDTDGLPIGVHHVYTVLKGERVIGDLLGILKAYLSDGTVYYDNKFSIEPRGSTFDWMTAIAEFSRQEREPRITNVEFYLELQGTGRIWVGASEIVNLGLPAGHVFYQTDLTGRGE